MPQQACSGGRQHPHPVVRQGLEGRVRHLGEELVDQAAHKKGDLQARGAGPGIHPAHLAVPGHRGQGFEMPVPEQRRHDAGAGGTQEVVHRLDEDPLEPGPPVQDAVKGPRFGQQPPKDCLFPGRQTQVARQDGPGLDEDVQHLDAAGAVGGAGAAQQTAAQVVLDRLGVLQDLLEEAVQQGQLAPRHVRFPAGFGEQRADRLAEAAAHADHQLVFQFLHQPGQRPQAGHFLLLSSSQQSAISSEQKALTDIHTY